MAYFPGLRRVTWGGFGTNDAGNATVLNSVFGDPVQQSIQGEGETPGDPNVMWGTDWQSNADPNTTKPLLQYLVASGSTQTDYAYAEIVETTDYRGATGKVLRANVILDDPAAISTSRVQLAFDPANVAGAHSALAFYVYLPEGLERQLNDTAAKWLVLAEIFGGTERITFEINGTGGTDLAFVLSRKDSGADDWTTTNSTVDVPVGRWARFELHYEYGTSGSVRVFFDGLSIFDQSRDTALGTGSFTVAHIKAYTSNTILALEGPMRVNFDAIDFWYDGLPPLPPMSMDMMPIDRRHDYRFFDRHEVVPAVEEEVEDPQPSASAGGGMPDKNFRNRITGRAFFDDEDERQRPAANEPISEPADGDQEPGREPTPLAASRDTLGAFVPGAAPGDELAKARAAREAKRRLEEERAAAEALRLAEQQRADAVALLEFLEAEHLRIVQMDDAALVPLLLEELNRRREMVRRFIARRYGKRVA